MNSRNTLSNSLTSEEVLEKFRRTGALLEGHFVLSSGLHSANYLQCALVLQDPAEAAAFGEAIASHFVGIDIETVVSPAIGGLIIGYEVARHLNVRFIWTERADGEMTLRRGFSITPGEQVLVVEDVITTGGSTRDTIEAVTKSGGQVVGAASIIDRSDRKADVGVPLTSLARLAVPSVEPAACAACARGEIAIKPGSRKK